MTINIVNVGTSPTIINSTANQIQWNLLPTPITGNQIIIVWALENSVNTSTGTTVTCTDNQGNTYQSVVLSPDIVGFKGVGGLNAGIFFCPSVVSSGTFTVTIAASTGTQTVTTNHIEVSGLASTSTIDKFNNYNSGSIFVLTPTIVNSAANLSANDFVVTIMCTHRLSTGITDDSTLIITDDMTNITCDNQPLTVTGSLVPLTDDYTLLTFDNTSITLDATVLSYHFGTTPSISPYTSLINKTIPSGSYFTDINAGYKIISATETSSAFWSFIGPDTGMVTAAIATFKASTVGVPGQVTNVIVLDVTATSSSLTWQSVSGALTYTIVRGGTTIVSNFVGTTYTDVGLSILTSYTYTVTAVNANGPGTPSTPVTITTDNTLNSTGPISLGGSTVGQSIELQLSEDGITSISLNDSNVRSLAGISSGQISFNNFYGNGTEILAPGQVTQLTATPVSSTSVNLSWNSVISATFYTVKRGNTIITTSISATIYTDSSLIHNTQYTYSVAAGNNNGTGPFSIVATVTTL